MLPVLGAFYFLVPKNILWGLSSSHDIIIYLVTILLIGGLEHFFFSHLLNIVIPIDELIFFRGVGIPPTSDEFVVFTWDFNHEHMGI